MLRFKRLFLYLILCSVMLLSAACDAFVEHDTITQKPGNYQFGINETVEIIDIETRETLGAITVTSCQLVEDQPFVVEEVVYEGNKRVTVKTTYSKLYQITCTVVDSLGEIDSVKHHFSPLNRDHVMDPRNDSRGDSFYIAIVEGGGGNKTDFALEFSYDLNQSRPTARFTIPMSGVSKAPSPEAGDTKPSSNEKESFSNRGEEDTNAVLGLILLMLFVLLLSSTRLFLCLTISYRKKLNLLKAKIDADESTEETPEKD